MGFKARRSPAEQAAELAQRDEVLEVARGLLERGDERSLLLAAHVAAGAQHVHNMSWDEIGADEVLNDVLDAALETGFNSAARAVLDFYESEDIGPVEASILSFWALTALHEREGREPPEATPLQLTLRAADGDAADVALLLRGVPVNAPGQGDRSALWWACLRGNVEIARLLLAAGADVEQKGEPLDAAVHARAPDVVKLLLEAGADPGDAVLVAASQGDIATLEVFAAAGGDVRALFGEAQTTPLHAAAGRFSDNPDVVRFLLDRGATVDLVDGIGFTPLEAAAEAGNPKSALVLLEAGASPSQTALALAVCNDASAEIVRALVAAGADTAAVDENGDTAMTAAIRTGCTDVVNALVELGVDIKPALISEPAVLLVDAVARGHAGLVRAIVAAGGRLDVRGSEGGGPVHVATAAGDLAMVDCLLDLGADPDELSPDLHTPLAVAARGNKAAVADRLLRAGAAVDRPSGELTSLVHAVKHDAYDALAVLIAAGADLEARDHERWPMVVLALLVDRPTSAMMLLGAGADIEAFEADDLRPLMAAASRGHDNVVGWLINAGAELESRGELGTTPLIYAAANGRASTVKLLLEAGADRTATNDRDETAADRARDRSHANLARHLDG